MAYDASFWRERRNWSALTGALTGAATRKDYLAMLRHIRAAREAGMPEEQIRRAYADVMKMLPSVPPLESLEQSGGAPPTTPTTPAPTSAPTVSPELAASPTTAPAAATTPPWLAERERPASAAEPEAGSATAPSSAPPEGARIDKDVAAISGSPTEPDGRPVVQQLDHWLSLLRTGDETQKIEAREKLSLIFEQRGMLAEAIEMLEGNVWAGVRDANMQRRLAALYRQIGRQDLADKAISDLYQLGMAGTPSTTAPYAGGSAVASPPRPAATTTTSVPDTGVAAGPEPGPEPSPFAPAWRRPRPVWLSIALMVATFGLYGPYWVFATWREIKREADNSSLHPIWHTLAVAFIPIYGWIRFFDHVRTIRRLAVSTGADTTLSPGLCLWLFIITAVINRLTVRIEPWTPTPPSLDPIVLAIDVILVAWPQAALTAAWKRLPGGAAPFHVHSFEWLLLILGGLVWAGVLLGLVPIGVLPR